MEKYELLYCRRSHDNIDSAVECHGRFETYKEALEERNWHFGHSPIIVRMWIERKSYKDGFQQYRKVGAVLTRK